MSPCLASYRQIKSCQFLFFKLYIIYKRPLRSRFRSETACGCKHDICEFNSFLWRADYSIFYRSTIKIMRTVELTTPHGKCGTVS